MRMLRSALADSSSVVRHFAAQSLGLLRDVRSAAPIIDVLLERPPNERRGAAFGVAELAISVTAEACEHSFARLCMRTSDAREEPVEYTRMTAGQVGPRQETAARSV